MKAPGKTALMLFLILTLASVAGFLGVQRHSIIALRLEQGTLSAASQEADRLAEENKMAGALEDESLEVQKLRAENTDLLKLRSEVGQLHDRLKELAKPLPGMQDPANRVQPSGGQGAQPEHVELATIADEGFTSPRATLATYLWALKQGNLPLANQCWIAPTNSAGPAVPQEREALNQALAGRIKDRTFTGYDLHGQSGLSQDEIVLEVAFLPAIAVEHVGFRLVDGAWKIAK
jgi:hypothetical protein